MFASKDTLLTRPSGGYSIARSVRFRASAQGYFSKTLTTPTNNKKWTYSVWMKRGSLSANRTIMSSNVDGAEYWDMRFNTSDQILIQNRVGSSNLLLANTTAVYRDPSAWYHIVFVFDSANATAANRNLLYVNGVNVALSANSGSSDASAWNTSGVQHNIGVSRTLTSGGGIWAEYDGYETEINFIDGQALTPSSFGTNNAITGVWQPAKYTGTYGTNGFYLNFSDNSSNTATTIGKDYSGNGNNWTPNNISVTSGITYDSMVDSPTVGATSSNYCVLNPLVQRWSVPNATFSNGNLSITTTSASHSFGFGTISNSSGKWYYEATVVAIGTNTPAIGVGGENLQNSVFTTEVLYLANGNKEVANVTTSYGASYTTNDVIGVAYDLDGGTITFYKNNTSQGSISLPVTTNILPYFDVILNANFAVNFGQRPFSYTPPTGFVALNTYNLPASTIKNGAAYMAATTWTSVGGTETITNTVNGIGFQPDFVWMKNRTIAQNNYLIDSNRGSSKILVSNTTSAEVTDATFLTSFNSNGFSLGSGGFSASQALVGWQWKAGGTSASNTNGSITSTVSVGATQGFSVVTYTASSSASTIGHGLGVAPSMIIQKNRDAVSDWGVYHISVGATKFLKLNSTDVPATNSIPWNDTTPTSTVFSIGTGYTSGNKYVAYCFAAVAGYSAFGSYTGNGSTDGAFVYLGFRPRFIMFKRTDTSDDWFILDTSRNTYNVAISALYPNSSSSETSNGFYNADIVSNGIKIRSSNAVVNASGGTYIYAAFAENPFKNALAR